jgi:hypothetical protein
MENHLRRIFTVTLVLIFVSLINYAQSGLKVRLAVNSGMFMSEPGSSDAVIDPLAASNPGTATTADFKSNIKIGIEAELSMPIGELFGVGFEVKDSKFSGYNDNPIYYNYFVSPYSPFLNYNHEPLIYDTEVINLLGNFRIFPLGHNTFTPYLKLHGGVGLIGTDLRFKSPENQVEKFDPLYSRGTRLSIAEPKRFSTAHFGGGVGFEYQVAGNFSLCAELTISYINSDIIDGVPNFTYDQELSYSVYYDIPTVTSQVSIGLCYNFGEQGRSSKQGSFGKSHRSNRGKTYNRSPFHRRN